MKIQCQCGCGKTILIRKSDLKKGWGRYFSKQCKTLVEEKADKNFKMFFPHQDIINFFESKGVFNGKI